jgi:uncharacterized cupin superfamily protein
LSTSIASTYPEYGVLSKSNPKVVLFNGLKIELNPNQSVPGKTQADPGLVYSTTILDRSADGRIMTGVWTCEPCGWARMEMGDRGEFFHVLEGSMIIQEDGGEPIEASPGTSVYAPPGWMGSWRVPSRLVKSFVTFFPSKAEG